MTIAETALEDRLAMALPTMVAEWDEGRVDNVDLARLIIRLVRPRECEHRLASPCKDRNGSCGTHLSPWPIGSTIGSVDAAKDAPQAP